MRDKFVQDMPENTLQFENENERDNKIAEILGIAVRRKSESR